MNARALSIFFALVGIVGFALFLWSASRTAPPTVDRKTTAQRVQEGPRIVITRPLSAQEDLSMVVVPSEMGDLLDTKCFIYRNREFNQVVFTCPDARQDEISVPVAERH